jgi:hypothetical protein
MGLDLRDGVAFLHLGFFIASGMVCQGQTVRQGVHKVMGGLEFVTAATRTFGATGISCTDRARVFSFSVFGFWFLCSFSPWAFFCFSFVLLFCFIDAGTLFFHGRASIDV